MSFYLQLAVICEDLFINFQYKLIYVLCEEDHTDIDATVLTWIINYCTYKTNENKHTTLPIKSAPADSV